MKTKAQAKGGKARAAKMTPQQRSVSASKAATARWSRAGHDRWHPMKVPAWVYENAKSAQDMLVRRGTDAIPPALLAKCPPDETMSLGLVIGLGLAALEEAMKKP